jgi:hypothetical protein
MPTDKSGLVEILVPATETGAGVFEAVFLSRRGEDSSFYAEPFSEAEIDARSEVFD